MKKSVVAILLGIAVAASMAGCSSTDSTGVPNSDTSGVVDSIGPSITDMSDEKVVETHKLDQVAYAEGETPANAYYKKGNDADGNICYIVNYKDAEGDIFLPLDGTVIYTTTEEESYMEKVSYSYKLDGETVEEEQNRIYVNTGDSSVSNNVSDTVSETSEPAETEQPTE